MFSRRLYLRLLPFGRYTVYFLAAGTGVGYCSRKAIVRRVTKELCRRCFRILLVYKVLCLRPVKDRLRGIQNYSTSADSYISASKLFRKSVSLAYSMSG